MGRNLDPRFTTGHGLLVKPGHQCVTSHVDMGESVTAGTAGKGHKRNNSHSVTSIKKKTQHNTGVGLHFCQFHLRVSDTRGGTLHLRARTLLTPTPDIPPKQASRAANTEPCLCDWARCVQLQQHCPLKVTRTYW